MASLIKTYTTRPECAVPNCKNEAFVHVGGHWICGMCLVKMQKVAEKEMFKKIVDASVVDE